MFCMVSKITKNYQFGENVEDQNPLKLFGKLLIQFTNDLEEHLCGRILLKGHRTESSSVVTK